MINRLFAAAVLSLAAPLSFATELYHPSNAEEGATLRTDHMRDSPSREGIERGLLAAQRDGSLSWISRGYPAGYPLLRDSSSTTTREQVLLQLQQWKRKPITEAGLTLMQGELGWVESDSAR